MREFKFRAWDLDGQDRMYIWDEIKNHFIEHVEHPRILIMQFTGLKDREGNEIYDGDIIESSKRYFIIKWFDGIAAYNCVETDGMDSHPAMNKGSMENALVVGNIYENPEYTGKLL